MTYAYVLYDGYRGDITSKIIDSLLQDISKLLVCEIVKNVTLGKYYKNIQK